MQKPRWIGASSSDLYEHVRTVTGLQGRKFDVVVETGSPDTAITVAARERDPDLIVIPGNLALEKILNGAHCAVLVVRQSSGHGVLAATDLSDPSHPALTAASAAAESSGDASSGMFGLHIPEIAALGVWGTHLWTATAMEEAADSARKELRDAMDSIRVTGDAIVQLGRPAEAILRTASRLGSSLIVVDSRSKGPLSRLLFGSVSEVVAAKASCSVLITKSDRVQQAAA